LNQIGEKTLASEDDELVGVRMRTANWNVLARDAAKPDEISFEYVLDKQHLRVVKTYSLARLKPEEQNDINAPAYHLNLR
ncbi:hypothetical protein Q8G41_28965, partial [Klebsiella pneumoniae]|uniref:hypothetical protein n=1 Tax=Klebsiella pneumoniae TaxID=573 RepID=UPI003013DB57